MCEGRKGGYRHSAKEVNNAKDKKKNVDTENGNDAAEDDEENTSNKSFDDI